MTGTAPLLRLLCVALSGLMGSGCVHVGHGPTVEPGTSGFISVAASRNTNVQDEAQSIVPHVLAGVTRGWVFDNGAAASLGLQLPPLGLPFVLWDDEPFERFARLVMADVYVQPHRGAPGAFAWGAGTLVSSGVIGPYVQFGTDDDGGIFTTQAVMIPLDDRDVSVIYWMPSLSFRAMRPDGSRRVDYYIGGIYGRAQYDFPARTVSEWAVTVGVVMGIRRRR